VLSVIHRHVYFPTYSNGLKEIGGLLGCRWTSADASGITSLVWRGSWERTRDPAVKDRLLTYNEEDCLALKSVCDFVARLGAATPAADEQAEGGPNVVSTADLPKAARKWPVYGRPTFVLDDLGRASECAYFDYQRERVYVRTDKRFRRINRRAKRDRLPLTTNKHVVIECSTCPACGSGNIKRGHRLKLKTIDMKFSKGGVKKWVVAYRSWAYKCADCGARFRSGEWPKSRALYQPGLACWCVYQNIECRQTMYQVRDTLADVFSLSVPERQFYIFKGWIAGRYGAV
jgi:hypothetical protein